MTARSVIQHSVSRNKKKNERVIDNLHKHFANDIVQFYSFTAVIREICLVIIKIILLVQGFDKAIIVVVSVLLR